MRLLVTGASGFIGTHLVDAAVERGDEIVNLDLNRPLVEGQARYWRKLDIMNEGALVGAVRDFGPDWLVHLAARTDCDENTTVDRGYQVNTRGTSNVLVAIRSCPSLQRAMITSTQFVFNKGAELPGHDRDYSPRTVYGQSKVIAEEMTRSAGLPCPWTIVRPTNVWGPWHLPKRDAFFYALKRGVYLHPGREPVTRSYGYVGTVVHQIFAVLSAPADQVHGRVFYLGDRPLDLLEWVNAFSRRLKGKSVRVVPRSLVRSLGFVGDGISRITGKPFLITSSRFNSMTEPYLTPMEPTFEALGESPFTLQDGVEATAAWLEGPGGL